MEDWVVRGNENSLFYLGSELRELGGDRAIKRLEELLALPAKNGPMRYHARLILAKMYAEKNDSVAAKKVLIRAQEDDWCRTEHWIWLGDLAFDKEHYEEALQWYKYAGSTVGSPPFTVWWIDLNMYSFVPAMRLAICYTTLGQYENALQWAKMVKEFLPEDSPQGLIDETDSNIEKLEGAIQGA